MYIIKTKCTPGYTGPGGGPCTACVAGTYKTTAGSSSCSACPANSLSPAQSTTATACVCSAGWQGPSGGPCLPSACNMGYTVMVGGTSCTACVKGTYKPTADLAACTNCPTNSNTIYTGRVDLLDCVCPPGYTGPAGQACTACVAGKYKATNGWSACSDCYYADSTSPVASDDALDCFCNAGYEETIYARCSACVAGKYKTITGSSACLYCPANSDSLAASPLSTSCVCNSGYSGPDGGTCTLCPVHSTTTKTACVCNAGYALLPDKSCGPCPTGKYLNYTTCIDCAANSHSPAGSSSMTACLCNAGYSGPDGGNCTACEVGTYKDTSGSQICNWCPAEYYTWPVGAISADACKLFDHSRDGISGFPGFNRVVGVYYTPAGYPVSNCDAACCYALCTQSPFCIGGFITILNPQYHLMPLCQLMTAKITSITEKPAESLELYSPTWVNTYRRNPTACDPGFTGSLLCTVCASGKYKPSADLAACTDCPSNSLSTGSACVCNAGYSGPDSGTCTACNEGQYKASLGADACINCVLNSKSPAASTSLTDCLCNAGYSGPNEGVCIACDMGTYKSASGAHTCTQCAAKFYSSALGAVSIDTCLACPILRSSPTGSTSAAACQCNPGYTGPSGGTTCTACDAGTYKDAISSGACIQCPANSVSPAGSSSLTACGCVAGYTGTNGSCTACPANSVSPAGSSSVTACVCVAGFTGTNAALCIACGTGKYKITTGADVCQQCPTNTNSPGGSNSQGNCTCNAGSTGSNGEPCVLCIAGKYKLLSGSAACTSCLPGQYSTSTVVGSTSNECNACPDDSFIYSDGNLRCALSEYTMTPGEFWDPMFSRGPEFCDEDCCATLCSQTFEPWPCYDFTVFDSSGCVFLGNGARSRTSRNGANTYRRKPCDVGFTGKPCAACATGTYKSTIGSAECTPCPNSTFSSAGSTVSTDCVCVAGYTGPNGGGCTSCGAGSYKSTKGTDACLQCPRDSYSSADSAVSVSTCTACPANSASLTGSNSSLACVCNAGYTGFNGDTCTACVAGTYKTTSGSHVCALCVAGKFNVMSGRTECTDCLPDQYSMVLGATSDVCQSCPDKSFIGSDGSTQCVLSDYTVVRGEWFGNNHLEQKNCDVTCCASLCSRTYEPWPCYDFTVYDLSSSCRLIENGWRNSFVVDTGATTYMRKPCAAGFIGKPCTACAAGTYQNTVYYVPGFHTDVVECKACPANTISPEASAESTACVCVAGYTGSVSCTACAAGTYKKVSGPQACITVPENTSPWPTTVAATGYLCNVAYTGLWGGYETCTLCEAGKYKEELGFQECTPCVFVMSPEGSVCRCGPGFTPAGGTCMPCGAGQYKTTQSIDACSACPANSVSPATSTSPTACQCNAGYTGPDGDPCSACALGTYKTAVGSSACTACDAGTYMDAAAPGVCTSCELGKYKLAPGAGGCISCVNGTYADTLGAVACKQCPPNKISPTGSDELVDCVCDRGYIGSSTCSACLAGTSKNTVGSGVCTVCESGKYAPPGSAVCSECPAYKVSPEGSDELVDCVCMMGYTWDLGGDTASDDSTPCIPCPPNQYKDTLGSGVCTSCATGKSNENWGAVSANQCTECEPGLYRDALDVGYPCRRCDMGTYSLGTSGTCTPCETGTYNDIYAASTCTVCPVMYLQHAEKFYPNSTRPQCTVDDSGCFVGFTALGDVCAPCELGTYKDTRGLQACITCTAAKYKDTRGPGVCTDCPVFSYSPTGSISIVSCVCHAGYAGSGADGRNCSACDAGKYKNTTGPGTCTNCTTDSWSEVVASTTADECACNAGYVSSIHNASAQKSVRVCAACPVGTYKPVRSNDDACTVCGPRTGGSPAGSTSWKDCPCNAGYDRRPDTEEWFTPDMPQTPCQVCVIGTYKTTQDFSSCIGCPANSVSSEAAAVCQCIAGYTGPDSGTCTACVANTYKDTLGSGTCNNCSANTQSPAASTSATACQCNAGYTGPNGGTCETCIAGKYKASVGVAACDSCPVNSQSPAASTAAIACQCNAGHTGPNGGTCAECAAGKYKALAGAAACDSCPANSITPAASTEIAACQCNAGYQGANGGTCTACAAGQYKQAVGPTNCLFCTEQSISPAASTQPDDCVCNAGFLGSGSAGCVKGCPAGYSNDGMGGIVCAPCATGTYKGNAGSELCTSCFAKSFMDEGRVGQNTSALCKCKAGTVRAGDSCADCAAGKFNHVASSSSCYDCYALSNSQCVLSTTPGTGASSCPGMCRAPAGWQRVGTDSIERCPENHYSDGTSLVCLQCPWPQSYTSAAQAAVPGYFAGRGPVQAAWCSCQPGYYRNSADTCVPAETGYYKPDSGDGAAVSCGSARTTLTTAATSAEACVCDIGWTPSLTDGSKCVLCAPGLQKWVAANLPCIQCPDHSHPPYGVAPYNMALVPFVVASCLCNEGYSGVVGSCTACEKGTYTESPGQAACTPCGGGSEGATTPARASMSRYDCSCDPGYRDKDLGPTVVGGSCVSICGPGTTRCSSDCAVVECPLCAPGTYKGVLGSQPCTPCAAPRSASRAGATSTSACSCRAGELDSADVEVAAGQMQVVLSLGAYADLESANVSGAGTEERCWSSVTSASIPDGVAALRIQVLRRTDAVVLFACTSTADCAQQKTALHAVALHGQCGRLQTVPRTVVDASWHEGRSVETAPATSLTERAWSSDGAVRRLALTAQLRPGDYILAETWLGSTPTRCVQCPPGMLCGASIP